MCLSEEVSEILYRAMEIAKTMQFAFVTPELVLHEICKNEVFAQAFENCGGEIKRLDGQLKSYFQEYMEPGIARPDDQAQFSQGMGKVLDDACKSAQNSGRKEVGLAHVVHAFYMLPESYAAYYLLEQGVGQAALLQEIAVICEDALPEGALPAAGEETQSGCTEKHSWQRYAPCLNSILGEGKPLIGRKEELERTMQVLCRKEKNNPLHIGEPGVGKTAVTYGLVKLLKDGDVPEPLRGAAVYSLDVGSLLAGAQYRGEFEKRFRQVMDGVSQEKRPIVYIDEIHNIVGAGAANGGSFDVSNMLKPYLAEGHVRFIGATTYEEYKKYFEKDKSLVRRFQNIEVKEPDIPETVRILEGLQESYERFHGVVYEEGVLEYAVQMSVKYMNGRFLPDKAIDLMDEAGAYRRLHPLAQGQMQPSESGGKELGKPAACQETEQLQKPMQPLAVRGTAQTRQTVGKGLIDEIVAKTCHIPKQTVESSEIRQLASLKERLESCVFGQEEAISHVVGAVKLARAGLLEGERPLASLLFIGPTGVGKTEVAKCLAKELGIRLVRFDMSEYGEKHAAAKLIGAPAGYVGYEEGGLLTEEIRKHPHAVLLLDEIEKAHPDVYNILLQVMDYATLTDNQGRKADFQNVVLIMTSNAGAAQLGKPAVGFLGEDRKEDAMLGEVKRIFQPEFRNRLDKIVVFRSMDEKMAGQVVEKKLGELQRLLLLKQVTLSADTAAKKLIKKKGISVEFGAREIERVIRNEVKPLFADGLLFGLLKNGGACKLTADGERFEVSVLPS